jgi:hypothetical protein
MKRQQSEIRDQRSVEQLLRGALPPVGENRGDADDLWPQMVRRMRVQAAAPPVRLRVPWFDWVLAAGLAGLLATFPAAIPMLLYYL